MRARFGRIVLLLLAALIAFPGQSAAVFIPGLSTQPSWTTVGASRRYGCVTTTASSFYGTNAEGITYACARFHIGVDFALTFDPVVSTRSGIVVTSIESNPDNPGSACVDDKPANMIVIDHGVNATQGRYSRYLHLTKDGSLVATGDHISAGQMIGTSGNSGITCGAHLHYGLADSPTAITPQHSYDPDGYLPDNVKWTTPQSPHGRAPWLTDYVSQLTATSPDVEGAIDVCYGSTVTYWVKFKNLGGRTWSWSNDIDNRGKVVLYSTTSAGTATQTSALQASDWETSSRITTADTSAVAADGTGTFTFGIKGGGTAGQTTTLYLNIFAFNLKALKYNDQVRVKVFVVPTQAC